MTEIAQDIRTHALENGLVLVMQPMPDVQSAAFSILVPAGSAFEPEGRNGTAAVLCDMLSRGAGERDSRALSAALDHLGVQRHESVSTHHLSLVGATVADNLPEALAITSDLLLRPHLPEEQFDAARTGVAQSLHGIEDEPRQKVIVELRRRCYDVPWGRPADGTLAELEAVDHAGVREHFERCFQPNGTLIGVAGRFDPDAMIDLVERLFADWDWKQDVPVETRPSGPAIEHLQQDTAQTHIGLAYPTVPYRQEDYYAAWAAVSVLSGGSSSRLHTEVREKRGLCYDVHASLHSLRDEARVLCYAGTAPDRAQETLDVTLAELHRLGEGIAEDELERCKARAKSSLVMQQESTMARAGSIIRDWFHLGHVRTLAEVRKRVDALTTEAVVAFVREHPPRDFTALTIGPQPLEVKVGVSP